MQFKTTFTFNDTHDEIMSLFLCVLQVPPELGPSLQVVYPIGGSMGWLFAGTTTRGAVNGYMLTGLRMEFYSAGFRLYQRINRG